MTKWVDYSSKYGLGYTLSNGGIGVYFNDSSKILQHSPDKFMYVSRDANKQEVLKWHNTHDFPPTLTKKHTLLAHFQSYLVQPEGQTSSTSLQEIYVKKWMKTKQALMFRLSNKVIQVVFKDNTEILLCSDWKYVQYLNKEKVRVNYPLNNALESENQEMAKRLRYTKEILSQMLGNNQAQEESGKTHFSEIGLNRGNSENIPMHLQPKPTLNNYLQSTISHLIIIRPSRGLEPMIYLFLYINPSLLRLLLLLLLLLLLGVVVQNVVAKILYGVLGSTCKTA